MQPKTSHMHSKQWHHFHNPRLGFYSWSVWVGDGGSGIPVPSCWSGMVPECGESHLSQTLVHPLLVQNWSWSHLVQYRLASFRTMCASSPIPDQYWPSVLDGDGSSPIPETGYDLAPSPTHTVQFLNRRRPTRPICLCRQSVWSRREARSGCVHKDEEESTWTTHMRRTWAAGLVQGMIWLAP
jgi:hypothetical protein